MYCILEISVDLLATIKSSVYQKYGVQGHGFCRTKPANFEGVNRDLLWCNPKLLDLKPAALHGLRSGYIKNYLLDSETT